jgi:hypothetical protein
MNVGSKRSMGAGMDPRAHMSDERSRGPLRAMVRYFWNALNAKRMPAACDAILTNGSTVIEMLPGSTRLLPRAPRYALSHRRSVHVRADTNVAIGQPDTNAPYFPAVLFASHILAMFSPITIIPPRGSRGLPGSLGDRRSG